MTYRDDLRVRKALQGAGFPASRASLLTYASSRDVDLKTMDALRTIPQRQYANMDEVADAIAQEPEGTDNPGGTAR